MTGSRVPIVNDAEAEAPAQAVFDELRAMRGVVPNMFRAAAGRPDQLRTLFAHYRSVMGDGTVPRLLRELLALRVASVTHCLYCLASHTAQARALGAKEHWLLAVRHDEPEPGTGGTGSLDDMEPGWIVALRYAELLTESAHRVTDEMFAKLRQHWDDGALLEITHVIGFMAYITRFNDALHVPVTA